LRRTARRRLGPLLAAGVTSLLLAACGGGSAKVGDCIDSDNQVVSCDTSAAQEKLVSDQEKKDAIACIEIGDKPQSEITVDGHKFCAEPQ
jgi:hypothetical protein